MSHPSWVCGLKLENYTKLVQKGLSHPSWVCGLKRQKITLFLAFFLSHPSWVCGLKQKTHRMPNLREGHTLRGCVD